MIAREEMRPPPIEGQGQVTGGATPLETMEGLPTEAGTGPPEADSSSTTCKNPADGTAQYK